MFKRELSKKEQGAESLFKEITENFPKLEKDVNIQMQGNQRTPNKINRKQIINSQKSKKKIEL